MRRRLHAVGAVPFTLVVGVLMVGMPVGILLNLFLVSLRGAEYASSANAVDLTLTLLILAPTLGALVGRSIWLWNAGKLGHGAIQPAPVPVHIDARTADADADLAEQARIAALRTKLLDLCANDPARLKARVIAMAALGYGYVLAMFGLVGGGIVLLVAVDSTPWLTQYGIMALGLVGLLLITALWVRVEPPAGVRVTQAGSPALFRMLTELGNALSAPQPDEVLLTTDLNAAVTELPRFGIFGAPRRYLFIGLPLLEALPLTHCRAILAHELAHLARQHAQGTLWVARLTITWRQIVIALQAGRHWARWAFLPFFRWYAPRLELHAQLVSRVDEHEADALAASASDAATAASALVRLHVAQLYMTEHVLPAVHRQSTDRREPPHDAAQQIAAALRSTPGADRVEQWTRSALADETLDRDTHPSVFRRVERLTGVSDRKAIIASTMNELASDAGERAADALFGGARLGKLRQRLSDSWQLEIIDSWNRWHASAQLWRKHEASGGAAEPLDVAWARAWWAASCESPTVAIPVLGTYLERDPNHVEAMVGLGKLLLGRGEIRDQERGLLLLEKAHLRDTAVALDACAALEAWHARHDRIEDVHRVQARTRQLERRVVSSLGERLGLSADDMLTAHQLPDATLAVVRRVCAEQTRVKRAIVVRKHVQYLTDQPCIVLVVEPDVPWYKPASESEAMEVSGLVHDRLARANVTDVLVLGAEPGRSQLLGRLRTIPGAEVYRKDSRQ